MPLAPDATLFAAPRTTADQCARFLCRRLHGEYTEHDIAAVIVPAYFAVCTPLGIDPTVLIAQMIHETGNLTSWWAQRPRRNPAGIGVTGQRRQQQPPKGAWAMRDGAWFEGVSFDSWSDDAIPAHVGRMLAYALPPSQVGPAQRALISKAMSYRTLPERYCGCAATLTGLNGTWAVPGHGYAQKLGQSWTALRRYSDTKAKHEPIRSACYVSAHRFYSSANSSMTSST